MRAGATIGIHIRIHLCTYIHISGCLCYGVDCPNNVQQIKHVVTCQNTEASARLARGGASTPTRTSNEQPNAPTVVIAEDI